jgi:uncharacterized protein YqjF (DUF2071 family)
MLRPRGFPSFLSDRFLEVNVRTYVARDRKPGIWFFSLDAESRAAVAGARAAFHLPYFHARMTFSALDSQCVFESQPTPDRWG